MFVKLAIFSCLVVAATAVWNGPLAGGVPAHQFPAGVSPQACPNFPNCNNPAVAANPNAPAPAGQYGGYNPGYNQYNPAPVPNYNPSLQSPLDRGEYTGDGDYHGEGLAESGAYGNTGQWNNGNNGQWNNGNNGQWNGDHGNNGQWNAGNNGQWNAGNNGQWNSGAYNPGVPAQIPAGVDAGACPNYPFCH